MHEKTELQNKIKITKTLVVPTRTSNPTLAMVSRVALLCVH